MAKLIPRSLSPHQRFHPLWSLSSEIGNKTFAPEPICFSPWPGRPVGVMGTPGYPWVTAEVTEAVCREGVCVASKAMSSFLAQL